MYYITKFELDQIISNSDWGFVIEIEGVLDASRTLCTVAIQETIFHATYGSDVKNKLSRDFSQPDMKVINLGCCKLVQIINPGVSVTVN